jgi:hypothetical protein
MHSLVEGSANLPVDGFAENGRYHQLYNKKLVSMGALNV